MNKVFKTHHPIRHAKSFKFAFKGILHALLNEANFRIQVIIAIATVIVGTYYKITNVEWALITLTMGFLLTAEMVNTVVEELMDHMFKEQHDVARVIKDLSAGFVLTAAVATLIILFLIFAPYYLKPKLVIF